MNEIEAAARAIRDEFGPGKDGGTRDDDPFYERLARAALSAAAAAPPGGDVSAAEINENADSGDRNHMSNTSITGSDRDEAGVVHLIEDLLAQGAQCPLCGSSNPHDHTGLEILCYRNGIKWARASQSAGLTELLRAVNAWDTADNGGITERQQARVDLHSAIDNWRVAASGETT